MTLMDFGLTIVATAIGVLIGTFILILIDRALGGE